MKLHALVVKLFGSLSLHAIRRPGRVLVLAGLVILAAAPGVARLKLRTDGHALVSPNAPEVLYDQSIRDKFGIQDQLVVLIRSERPEGIFNSAIVQLLRELTAELKKLPDINPANVLSLATEPSFRLRPGSIFHQTLLEPPLESAAELQQLREDLRRIELYTGTFVSEDGHCTVILVGVPDKADREALYRSVLELTARTQRRLAESPGKPFAPVDITVTGAPVAESLLGLHILEDLGVPRSLLGASTQRPPGSGGIPHSFHELRLLLARRVGLVPVAAVVMMLIFLLCFRNALAMLVPMPGIAATLVFVFGLMGWCGVPVYLTMAVMPVLLIATGVTNDIYLFNRYFRLLREKPGISHVELLKETFDKMASPVASTSLTAGIGFLSFAFSPLTPVRAFGIFTGIGALFGLLYSLTVVPALLSLLNPAWLVSGKAKKADRGTGETGGLEGWFGSMAVVVIRRRWWLAALGVGIIAAAPLGLRLLRVQDSWIDAFAPDSELRRATSQVNQEFDGMHLLFVSFEQRQSLAGELPSSALTPDGITLRRGLVEHPVLLGGSAITLWLGDAAGRAGRSNSTNEVLQSQIELAYGFGGNISAWVPRRNIPTNFLQAFVRAGNAHFEVVVRTHLRPETIRSLAALADFIRQRRQYAVGGVLGPADYLATTRFMARPNEPGARRLPADPPEAKLLWEYYGLALGQERLRQLVETNYWQSLTTVFLKDANFADTARLLSDLRDYERVHLAPQGIRLGFAGDVALSQSLIHGIVSTQLQSLFWSIAGIYLVTVLLGGSWRWGAYCVLPSLLAVLLKFAVMGWLGIPLGVATSMFAAMTLGIGVNCAIQLLEAYHRANADGAGAAKKDHAVSRAMALTGPPALINTVAVSLGFGVLMLSEVPANARLGLLVVLGLSNCFLASLALLPVMLHWWPLNGRGKEGAN